MLGIKVQQAPQTTPQLLELLLQQQRQLQPKPKVATPQQTQCPATTQPASSQTVLQQLLQQLGVWPTQQPSTSAPQQVVIPDDQPSPQQQVPSPISVSSLSSTAGSPPQPGSPMSPIQLSPTTVSPRTQQASGFMLVSGLMVIMFFLLIG